MGTGSLSAYESKIRQLKGCKLTPDTVLARTMDKRNHIKAVLIAIQWTDETVDVDWSQMSMSQLCFMSKVLDFEIQGLLKVDE